MRPINLSGCLVAKTNPPPQNRHVLCSLMFSVSWRTSSTTTPNDTTSHTYTRHRIYYMDTQSPLVLNITCGSQCDHLSLSNRDFVIYLHLMLCEVFFLMCVVCVCFRETRHSENRMPTSNWSSSARVRMRLSTRDTASKCTHLFGISFCPATAGDY